MNKEEIIHFIENTEKDLVLDYYNKCYDKLKTLNAKIDRLTLYLFIVGSIYFIASKKNISSFDIGPISFNDFSLIVKLLPLIFSYLMLDIIIISGHKTDVFRVLKIISSSIYKKHIDEEIKPGKNNFLSRVLMPFSYSIELSKLSSSGQINILEAIIGFILFLPMIFLVILPFIIEFFMLQNIYINYFNDSLGKISLFSTLWVTALMFFYVVRNAKRKNQDT